MTEILLGKIAFETICRQVLIELVKHGFEASKNWFMEKFRDTPHTKVKEHTFPEKYTGPVLIQIKNLKQDAGLIIWWGGWIRHEILKLKNEQYILLRKNNEDAWPLTVFLTSEASIEFIHDVVDDGNWKNAPN